MHNTPAHSANKLIVAMELSNTKWLLGFYNGDKIRRKTIDARDRKRFLAELALAKEKLGLPPDAEVVCCYEAGRDVMAGTLRKVADALHEAGVQLIDNAEGRGVLLTRKEP